MKPVDLHLVSWNRPNMTELVIRTIHQNTKQSTFRLMVIDNGSEETTKDMLRGLHEEGLIHHLLLLDENAGLEWARQEAFTKETYGNYFVDIDNDCLPPIIKNNKDWLQRLVELMGRYEDMAAISMRTQVMIGTGNIFEEADKIGLELVEFPHPGGSYRIMNANAVRLVGGWDREAEGRGAEERYIGGKLRDAGFKTAFATNIQCLHLFGNRDKTSERWGYEEGMQPEETGHSDIDHPALRNGDDYQEVLKYSGEELTKRYFNA